MGKHCSLAKKVVARIALVGLVSFSALASATADENAVTFATASVDSLSSNSLSPTRLPATSGSSAYPSGDFYSQLSSAKGNAPQACDWGWGAGGSPFRPGPGDCDNYRVGPQWDGRVDGVFLFRDDTDITALAAAANAGGVTIPAGGTTLTGNFDHGAGVRLSLVGRQSAGLGCSGSGYEMHVGYLGIFGWDAEAFNPDVPPAGPIGTQPDLIVQRSLSYESSLHSLEVNGRTVGDDRIKLFGGVRYLRLAEDVNDFYDESSSTPSLPTVPVADLELTDVLRSVSVDNNLIGFQGGFSSDLFSLGDRFYLSGFANAGAYCNVIQRSSLFRQTDRFLRADDPLTTGVDESINTTATAGSVYKSNRVRMSLITEATLSAVYQVNRCTSAQLGYQLLYINGVELGDEAFLGATPSGSDLLMHGWFAGVEYRR